MKIVGIVAEYNPLHNGHKSHLERSKEISGSKFVVVVMSGNFVQRGEPALCDKWRRTEMAIRAGADLVIELPVRYATAGAGYFAGGAVRLLERTGIVDCMCFGSEWADIAPLKKCAEELLEENDTFKEGLRYYLGQGLSYPAARARAARVILPDAPNNVLGVEYIIALMALESKIVPYTVPRAPVSAKEIRTALKKTSGCGKPQIDRHTEGSAGQPVTNCNRLNMSEYMPPFAGDILGEAAKAHGLADLDNLSSVFHFLLRTNLNLKDFADVSEGLENRLIKAEKGSRLISEIVAAAKTKRYTYLRLQRAALHMILGITKKDMEKEPQYIRVLGFSQPSLLRMLKERAVLPVVLNLKNAVLPPIAAEMLEQEIQSSAVYSLAYPEWVYFNEYAMPLVKIPAESTEPAD